MVLALSWFHLGDGYGVVMFPALLWFQFGGNSSANYMQYIQIV